MTIALWIVNIILALMIGMAGVMKTLTPRQKLGEKMAWVEDFTAPGVKAIGIAEVLGAIGLIVPLATGILPILTPIAAVCLAVLMIGAVIVHIRRSEPFMPSLVLAVLAIVSAALGFIVVA